MHRPSHALRTGGTGEWGGVNLTSGGLMHNALQATGTAPPLIMPVLNLVPRREALLSPQFYRNAINMDMKKAKRNRIRFEIHGVSRMKIKMYL